jgi:hypothetical protein
LRKRSWPSDLWLWHLSAPCALSATSRFYGWGSLVRGSRLLVPSSA